MQTVHATALKNRLGEVLARVALGPVAIQHHGLLTAAALRRRAETALQDYVGNLERVRNSIAIACALIDKTARPQ